MSMCTEKSTGATNLICIVDKEEQELTLSGMNEYIFVQSGIAVRRKIESMGASL